MDVVLAHPPEYKLMPEILEKAQQGADASGGSFKITHDMDEAFADADVVYPKSWGCMLTTSDHKESAEIGKKYKSWIADERLASTRLVLLTSVGKRGDAKAAQDAGIHPT